MMREKKHGLESRDQANYSDWMITLCQAEGMMREKKHGLESRDQANYSDWMIACAQGYAVPGGWDDEREEAWS